MGGNNHRNNGKDNDKSSSSTINKNNINKAGPSRPGIAS